MNERLIKFIFYVVFVLAGMVPGKSWAASIYPEIKLSDFGNGVYWATTRYKTTEDAVLVKLKPGKDSFIFDPASVDKTTFNYVDKSGNPVGLKNLIWNSRAKTELRQPPTFKTQVTAFRVVSVEAKEEKKAVVVSVRALPRKDFFKYVMNKLPPPIDELTFARLGRRGSWDALSTFAAGTFEKNSLEALEEALEKKVASMRASGPGFFKIILFNRAANDFRHLADVGALQAMPENKDAVFQLASNFHCLEGKQKRGWWRDLKGPLESNLSHDVNPPENVNLPGIGYRGSVETLIGKQAAQGEEGSLSAAPGAIWRMYFVSQDEANLLSGISPDILIVNDIGRVIINSRFNDEKFNTDDFEKKACIGFHGGISVITGLINIYPDVPNPLNSNALAPDGQRVNQVLTAALDLVEQHYTSNGESFNGTEIIRTRLAQALLRVAYRGALLAAIAHGKKRVFLTLIGGSAFKNKPEWIVDAIIAAQDIIKDSGLEIFLVGFAMREESAIRLKTGLRGIIKDDDVYRIENNSSQAEAGRLGTVLKTIGAAPVVFVAPAPFTEEQYQASASATGLTVQEIKDWVASNWMLYDIATYERFKKQLPDLKKLKDSYDAEKAMSDLTSSLTKLKQRLVNLVEALKLAKAEH